MTNKNIDTVDIEAAIDCVTEKRKDTTAKESLADIQHIIKETAVPDIEKAAQLLGI